MMEWHELETANAGELPENEMKLFSAGTRAVILIKRNGNIHAFTAKCPHAGAMLCDGWIDVQGRVVCPEHKYRFDPVTGRNTSGEGYKLFTYPVKLEGNRILIGVIE